MQEGLKGRGAEGIRPKARVEDGSEEGIQACGIEASGRDAGRTSAGSLGTPLDLDLGDERLGEAQGLAGLGVELLVLGHLGDALGALQDAALARQGAAGLQGT